jgi:hypothetical protein
VPAGTNALQYLTQINETAEFGRLFMSRAGVLTFQERIGTTLSAPVAAFHDDGTNFPYDGVGISFEADAVVNRAVVTGLDGKPQPLPMQGLLPHISFRPQASQTACYMSKQALTMQPTIC